MDPKAQFLADLKLKEWSRYFASALAGTAALPESHLPGAMNRAAHIADMAVAGARVKYHQFCKEEV
jgi:hypothetical protein